MAAYIEFERVWKRFQKGQAHDSLRDLVPSLARQLMRRPANGSNGKSDKSFWALRDLSFEVRSGEVLGIIGPNGAGKSTTLKILNGIMDPTAGVVRTNGKIGSLIEVSAGFHPDLTGRQNVYLQGAIMGMRKTEVERKFDEIVAFAGVEEFLDTPVKRYSSGMNARLGFSIAAHLEPEILIIDEVLAVGDAAFQAKAFGRIKQMARAGAPVVLVSHQLDRIAELCTKAILLDRGTVRMAGPPLDVINLYLHGVGIDRTAYAGDVGIHFTQVVPIDNQTVLSGETLTVLVTGTAAVKEPRPSWTPALRVRDVAARNDVYCVTGFQRGVALPTDGEFEYELALQMNVQPGRYEIQAFVWDAEENREIVHSSLVPVQVLERLPFYNQVQLNSEWRIQKSAIPTSGGSRGSVSKS
ncbi:MAG TPA: polysaccharide ABC transporter ATP-binding protein [Gemmatimonadaceae bacterium]|jgi:ABC-type polysaccharide/polyol phosphate transport system ATPase subunit|nr:polysaccharide ABC transporter ATP-binding protein [Gemmatimonadaceae bacterium]